MAFIARVNTILRADLTKTGPHGWRHGWIRDGMHAADDEERAAFGQRTGRPIPPAWTDVHIADDERASLQATGRDSKGRLQSIYSREHTEGQAAAKFDRIHALDAHLDKLDAALDRDAGHDDDAGALLLIRKLGMRPGSDRDTGADAQAHGATNLRAKHAKVSGDRTRFDFIGKKGVRINLTVADPQIAEVVGSRLQTRRGNQRLFDTDENRVRTYFHGEGGVPEGFLLKDLRTTHANVVALAAVRARKAPTNAKEYAAARRAVAEEVAAQLGNTPTIALASYISPTVFTEWAAAAGVDL